MNYVSRQPTSGPIQSEADFSFDSYGSPLAHYGSGGNTGIKGLDYRFDVSGGQLNSFVDGDFRDLTDLSGQLNYHVTSNFMVWGAVEYKKDSGQAYWGTPLVPTSFAGSNAVNGVVSGVEANTFSGSIIGPLTVDSRTLTTNYNVADNATGAQELWLRNGFEWAPLNNVTIKDQVYYWRAKANWLDSETYAFDDGSVIAANTIDRDRFFVTHDQQMIGNNADMTWDSRLFGFDNRFAAQLQTSRDWITFVEEGDPNDYPYDNVSVVDPVQGLYGSEFPDTRGSRLTDVAGSFEDRLKITPEIALIGGMRLEALTLDRSGANYDGSIPTGLPFSKTWTPVSYRGALTYEPIHDLMFYGMYATAYDPAAAGIFSLTPGTSLQLTSARTYETGAKQLLWDGKAEWTVAAYDIVQRNVYVPVNTTTVDLAGEVESKGLEVSAAISPIPRLEVVGQFGLESLAFRQFRHLDRQYAAERRTTHRQWRRILSLRLLALAARDSAARCAMSAPRFVYQDNLTTMDAYTTADIYAFVDIPGRDVAWPEIKTFRITARVRNLTNTIYAAYSDPGYPDQVYLGAPRTYEVAASAKW